MTPAERGGYIQLLCHAWLEGSLPVDDKPLAILSGLGKAWGDSKEKILACFVERKGKLWHRRLEVERKKQKVFSEDRQAAGKAGAKKRWGNPPSPAPNVPGRERNSGKKACEIDAKRTKTDSPNSNPEKDMNSSALGLPMAKNSFPVLSSLSLKTPPMVPPRPSGPGEDKGGGGTYQQREEINCGFSEKVRQRLKEFRVFTDISAYEEKEVNKAISYVLLRRHTLACPGGALVAWLQKHGHVKLDMRRLLSAYPRGP